MTATNHVLAGALIATVVPRAELALPMALMSHLALDALPHYSNPNLSHKSRKFFVIVGGDTLLALTILLLILITQPTHWWLMVSCGVIAASPDLLWLPYWLAELKNKHKLLGPISRWLTVIQRFEFAQGWAVELSWFVVGLTLLLSNLSAQLVK